MEGNRSTPASSLASRWRWLHWPRGNSLSDYHVSAIPSPFNLGMMPNDNNVTDQLPAVPSESPPSVGCTPGPVLSGVPGNIYRNHAGRVTAAVGFRARDFTCRRWPAGHPIRSRFAPRCHSADFCDPSHGPEEGPALRSTGTCTFQHRYSTGSVVSAGAPCPGLLLVRQRLSFGASCPGTREASLSNPCRDVR